MAIWLIMPTHKSVPAVPGSEGQSPSVSHKKPKYANEKKSSGQSQFFADNGKDHIILGFRHKSQFLQVAAKSSSEKPAASNSIKSLNGLKTLSYFSGFRHMASLSRR